MASAMYHHIMCPASLLAPAGTILTKSALNPLESVELGRLVMSQNKKQLLDNWWKVGSARLAVQFPSGLLPRLRCC